MSERVTSIHRGAVGGAEWRTPSAVYVWFGPGGGLYLKLGRSLARIEHSAASGTYETSNAARRALDAFVAAVPTQEGGPQR
jgi:hypothetical protein